MTALSFALVLTGVLFNASAQLLLKAGANAVGHFEFHLDNALPVALKFAVEPHMLGGIACYAVSLVVWVMALSRVPVSVAYPLLSIGYIVNAVAAHFWLGEALSWQKLLGIACIILGVWFMARQ